MPLLKALLSATALAVSAITIAQSAPVNRPSRYIYAFYGQSAIILGSEDTRYGGGFGIAYGKPEPKFTMNSTPAQLVYEVYYDRTSSASNLDPGHSNTYAVGGLAMSRWFWPRNGRGWGVYADLGWGLQYASHSTHDLDSEFNSTPVLGFGGIFPVEHREFLIGLRYLHISNAGFVKPNRGQNELFLTVGLRF